MRMPDRTATYAKNSVVLKAAFVSVPRRRRAGRGAVAPWLPRSVAPARVVAGVLMSSSWDVWIRSPAQSPTRSANTDVGDSPAADEARELLDRRGLIWNYPSLHGGHSLDRRTAGIVAHRHWQLTRGRVAPSLSPC